MKWFETIKHGFPDPLGSCQAIKHKNYCFAPGSKFELCTKSTLPASLCSGHKKELNLLGDLKY